MLKIKVKREETNKYNTKQKQGYASHCPLSQQKKTSRPIHVAQKITVIRALKIGKSAV